MPSASLFTLMLGAKIQINSQRDFVMKMESISSKCHWSWCEMLRILRVQCNLLFIVASLICFTSLNWSCNISCRMAFLHCVLLFTGGKKGKDFEIVVSFDFVKAIPLMLNLIYFNVGFSIFWSVQQSNSMLFFSSTKQNDIFVHSISFFFFFALCVDLCTEKNAIFVVCAC